jgi:hypothetical protein
MNAWDTAKSLTEKHTNVGGLFVRLASRGDKVTGVFCGEPYTREVVWTGERYEIYDARQPAHQAEGRRPSLRVAMNFFALTEGAMKVIEGGSQWFKDVLKVRDKYGLDRWSFEIERHGDAGDPKTKYTILPEEKIGDDLRQKLATTALHDLESLLGSKSAAGPGREEARATPAGGEPIDHETGMALVARLKGLPRSCVDEFLVEMGVQRIRQLTVADLPRARVALARLEGAPGGGEVDPFA